MIFPRGGQFGASGTTTFCSKRHNQGVLILKAKDLERKVEKKKLKRVSNLGEPSPYVPVPNSMAATDISFQSNSLFFCMMKVKFL